MGKFAVIDTQTNWVHQVMRIGTLIADADTFLWQKHTGNCNRYTV